jgi:hypothetical protein
MTPLTLRLKPAELEEIRYRLSIEEPRVIRRANILNCLHLGYVSSQIAQILNVDPKTVTNVGNAYLEGGLESGLYDEERAGRPMILMIGSARASWRWCARSRQRAFIAGRWT